MCIQICDEFIPLKIIQKKALVRFRLRLFFYAFLQKKQEVEKKIDELSQETNTMLDGQEW